MNTANSLSVRRMLALRGATTRVLAAFLTVAWLTAHVSHAGPQDQPQQPEFVPVPEVRAATALKADTQGEIWFDSSSPFDFDILLHQPGRAQRNSTMAYFFLPEGASAKNPAPAVVFLPGSGGIRLGRQMLLADYLVENGYAVAMVDYYLSRGIDIHKVPYQTMVNNVTEFDIVTDAYAALNALQKHPAVNGERIGVIGFSYGGMATRLAMDERVRARLAKGKARFQAHIDFYGPCFQDFNTIETTGAALLTLRGELDSSNDLVACAMREEALRAAGSAVASVVYASAGHAWEGLKPMQMNRSPHVRGCTLAYDERGLPSINGKRLMEEDAAVDRATRHKLRAASGRHFMGCLKYGYYVGRHARAHTDSKQQMISFLDRFLKPADPQ